MNISVINTAARWHGVSAKLSYLLFPKNSNNQSTW